ncbi:class 1 fructose-bisphosphatase [Natronospirillum operosum]|uniref:Fructose-1,6-bisphosphatase class 1 n=1 Tax=Natronospirillum operosum TaxID=2759953 RepID=A0A4Z0WCE1_9GAMM|nr:class 1 fructose-bisphosphatase [Natronospirillum operosum]TGG92459.1 class 1 fructose-bisphosphatase [Natronospirillum operosum]
MSSLLKMPNDREISGTDVCTHLAAGLSESSRNTALIELIDAITQAAIPLGRRLALGHLPGNPADVVGVNDSGDRQKALDFGAHQHLLSAVSACSVRSVLSEEAEEVIAISAQGEFDLAIDPIDGSGSIGIGAPLGLLFAIFPAGESFLRSGRDTVAAGYISFGHSTDLGVSVGRGLSLATLDMYSNRFRVTRESVTLPRQTTMVAYNASNIRHLPIGLQQYLGDLIAGSEGPAGKNYNMRWLAAAVGELHRIVLQGGIFMYPGDSRPGFENGHLRLIYEAFPIAWLIEQAGGLATDGLGSILDKVPASLHEKTPLLFGSAEEIQRIKGYFLDAPSAGNRNR